MGRTYIKKVGGRNYMRYDPENMLKAVAAVKKGMSQKSASIKFKVPRTTLLNKIHEHHPLTIGRPSVITQEDERVIAHTLGIVSDWGFPLTHADIRQVVAKFVTRQGRHIPQWKNNEPGIDFVHSFATRNNLSTRLANNIKRQRAAVGEPQLREFFTNIKNELETANPQNVYNYDETNITDDPGAKKVLVPRGTKRVERVQDHSRTSVSVMICGTAAGDLLPPMVVYKAQHLYENWTVGGPKGTVYDSTFSGWFDMQTFEKWFFEILIPHTQANSTPGQKKIVIGDNLAAHFSPRVIEAALENNIYMTPLPVNSTHLMQPLDVSFFAPMKKKWRQILDSWRKESRRKGSIPKEQFPALLSRLWSAILDNSATNLRSGFRATGICPFSPERVLAKIPTRKESGTERSLDESLLEFLKESRGYTEQVVQPQKRGKKVSTRPGQQMAAVTADTTPNTNTADKKGKMPQKKCSEKVAKTVKPPKTLSEPTTSRGVKARTNADGYCSECNCSYQNYTDKRDWICCVSCLKWVCGKCNLGSKDPQYECSQCNCCSICLIQFNCYTNKKAWIKCVTCNKWVCGHCNGGSKQTRYECPECCDD